MNTNQAFIINGLNGKQAKVVRSIQSRSYVEGNLNTGSAVSAGLAAGFTSAKLAAWLRGMVVASEAPAVAMAVTEGTLAATLLTTVVPVIGGIVIGIGVGYAVKYIGEKIINDSKELNLEEALANGDIVLLDTTEKKDKAIEDSTGLMLYTNNPLLQRLHAKKAAQQQAQATADKSAGEAAQTAAATA